MAPPLLYRYFERGEVYFAQGAFIDDAVRDHAAQFLIVGGKVLYAGIYAVGLYAADVCGAHFAGEVGVFGIVFEVSAAQRIALDVHAGTEQHVDALGGSLFAEQPAHAFDELGIPAVAYACRRGQAGGGKAGIEPEVVACGNLFADAAWTIGKPCLRKPYLLNAVSRPEIPAREQVCLLAAGKFTYFLCMLQQSISPCRSSCMIVTLIYINLQSCRTICSFSGINCTTCNT